MDEIVYIGYHGTDESEYDNIDKSKSYNIEIDKKLPCDLGLGLYLYINRKHNPQEAAINAYKYLDRWKPRYKNKIIAEIHVSLCEDNILNFDDYDNQIKFEDFRNDNEESIKEVIESLTQDNTFHRGNFDGIIIELMIEEYDLKVDAIIKETYTQFDKGKRQKRSHFPNGREMCLKNYNKIAKKCIYK